MQVSSKIEGVSMYSLISKISQTISEPITVFLYAYEHFPFIIAILLGLVGALAPCQLTGNMSAITFYGNRSLQMKNNLQEIVFFILGKVVVFSLCSFIKKFDHLLSLVDPSE